MSDIILKYDPICLTHKYIDSWFLYLYVLIKLYKIISYIYRQWNWKKMTKVVSIVWGKHYWKRGDNGIISRRFQMTWGKLKQLEEALLPKELWGIISVCVHSKGENHHLLKLVFPGLRGKSRVHINRVHTSEYSKREMLIPFLLQPHCSHWPMVIFILHTLVFSSF